MKLKIGNIQDYYLKITSHYYFVVYFGVLKDDLGTLVNRVQTFPLTEGSFGLNKTFRMNITTILKKDLPRAIIRRLYWVPVPFVFAFWTWISQRATPFLQGRIPESYWVILQRTSFVSVFYILVSMRAFFTTEKIVLVQNGRSRWNGKNIVALIFLIAYPVLLLIIWSWYSTEILFIEVYLLQGAYMMMAASAIVGSLSATIKKWHNAKHRLLELQRNNAVMEKELLQARTSPHFLFNTINNIDALIGRDPEKASLYLNKLSHILRFMLYESGADRVPLGIELNYIEEYVNLQRIRSVNQDFVRIHIAGDSSRWLIAPMIFIPIIENAFKHVSTKLTNDAITLDFSVEGNQIIFNCKNLFQPGKPSADEGGLGLGLVQQRLELMYPGKYSMNTEVIENNYQVYLKIDLDAA
ncbi:MAG: histidine kinase [Chitinophaga sp.]|uniref:sensor histidine kinase n=1 Tax=Chitinophaga sp. TaxID=1869181 RepID=UPI0025BCECD1|nr:histidine kinase [Chitinophaga sp.]MBV8252630.1 histidine kinase [Chitinophaga sp.]